MTPVHGLRIYNLDRTKSLSLPKTFSYLSLPLDHNDIIGKSDLEQWPHLREVANLVTPVDTRIPIGLIVGVNAPRAMEPYDVIRGVGPDSPYAIRTLFGWTVSGPSKQGNDSSCVKSNFLAVHPLIETNSGVTVIPHTDKVNDMDLMSKFEHMYKTDYTEWIEPATSQEDSIFMDLLERETIYENGRY
jgi:hypothetical protein